MFFNSGIHSLTALEREKKGAFQSVLIFPTCLHPLLSFSFGGFFEASLNYTLLQTHASGDWFWLYFCSTLSHFQTGNCLKFLLLRYGHFFSLGLLFLITLKAHLNLWSRGQFWKELASGLTALKQLIIWVNNWWTALFSSSMINRVMPWSICPSKGFGYHKFFCSCDLIYIFHVALK